jgi:cytoskeletal protein RodZ
MRVFLVVLAVLGLSAASFAQGLGDVAAREREKRKAATTGDKRVYDNADLDEGRPPGEKKEEATASSAAKGAAPAEEAGAAQSPEEAQRARVHDAEETVRAAEQEVARLEARQQELQDMLNPMSIKYVYGQARSIDATAEEQRLKEELAGMPARIESAKKAVLDAQSALAEARRPPQG